MFHTRFLIAAAYLPHTIASSIFRKQNYGLQIAKFYYQRQYAGNDTRKENNRILKKMLKRRIPLKKPPPLCKNPTKKPDGK